MINQPKLGLVTVLYNGIEVLEGFFESLSQQTFTNYILYVIDNSPDDITLNEAKKLSKLHNITSVFINNNANLGVAKGNNQGIKASLKNSSEYILLLNYDIEFKSDTIEKMLLHAENNNEKIVVPKIYYYGTNKLWMAGGEISEYKGMTYHRGLNEEDNGQYDNNEYIGYAPTCFMLLHKNVFDKVGFMDEKYFVYFDDTDFIYRAKQNNFKIKYLPSVVINHKVSFNTGGDEGLFGIYYLNRNRSYFIRKNFSYPKVIISLSFFYLTRLIKALKFNKLQRKELYKALKDGVSFT